MYLVYVTQVCGKNTLKQTNADMLHEAKKCIPYVMFWETFDWPPWITLKKFWFGPLLCQLRPEFIYTKFL